MQIFQLYCELDYSEKELVPVTMATTRVFAQRMLQAIMSFFC